MSQLLGQESLAFERAITVFRPSRILLNQAVSLFRLYGDENQFMPDEMSSVALVAMFFAESAQQIRDLKGRKISGMGLTFSRLIGGCSSVPLMIDQIGKFVNLIHMQSSQKSQIQMYSLKAKATYQFMQLFQSYINKLQLISAQYIQNVKYKEIFIQLAWILYIDCRENYIKPDINAKEQNNCLLASVFYFMIRYSLEYIYPRALKIEKNSQKRAIIVKILEFLLDIFHIQQIQLYKKVADKFDEYVERLITNFILKVVGSETDFFHPNIIYLNFKQLQNRYQKRLQPKDIDYRVFRKEKSLTPIHKEALLHIAGVKKFPVLSKSMAGQFRSHRALQYEDFDSPNDQNEKQKINIQAPPLRALPQIFIKKRNGQHKPHFSSSFIIRPSVAIPDGINTQIYRYVNTLMKSSQRTQKSVFFQKSFEKIQKKVLANQITHPTINKKSIYFTIYSVYVSLAQKIFAQEIQSEYMHNCLISISFFIVYQMHEQIQNQRSICDFIIDERKTNYIDLWYCLKFFLQNDENLPPQLVYTYENEQQEIMCSLIWKNNQFIDQIAQLAANYQKDVKFVTFSQKIMDYCENFIKTMVDEVQASNQISINAYNCIKYILSANGSIMQDHHIDQILMCSLYIAGKSLGMPILFYHIKQAYEIIFRNKNRNFQQIFNKIQQNQGGYGDIIYFYNFSFINSIRPFLPYMGNPSLNLLHPLFQRQINEQTYQRGNAIPVNIINIMETTKPKMKKSKSKLIQKKNQALPFAINSERNETRVRLRPILITQNSLCETQRMKNYDNQRYSSSEEQ